MQRGYEDAPTWARLVGLHELLCDNCGFEFKGLDPSGKLRRVPSTERESSQRRRSPRYKAHLLASISVVETTPQAGRMSYSNPARGHCLTINAHGLAVSFVGAHFREEDLADTGRLLLVNIVLPGGPIEALVTTVTHDRLVEEGRKPRWVVGASITRMSEGDRRRLTDYLETRARMKNPPPPVE